MATCWIAVFLGLWVAASSQPIGLVDTEYGLVQGNYLPNVWNGEFSADVIAYHAIPFAKDTSGSRRFRYPEKRDPWAPDVFVADKPGPACPQGGSGRSEDCLHLDIYAPTTIGPHPVMVWFFGGAFQSGENAIYPGHFLATRDVVVVVVNYRLGEFGFAYTGNDAAPGNMGLFDQLMALEFVRDNIANFGGDPNKVTVFGQSAGAASAAHHTVSPLSAGRNLIHQAILESGTERNFWSINLPESNPENYIRQVAESHNCSVGYDDYQMMDCLREVPFEDLAASSFDCTPGWYCLGMAPVVDGVFLPDRPRKLRESGNLMKGPIITGMTDSDGSLYTAAMIPASLLGGFNRTEYLYWFRRNLWSIWEPLFDEETGEEVFNAIDFNYAPWPYLNDEYENREAFNKMITDAAFAVPMDRQMKDHQKYNNIYGYRYGYRGRNSTIVPEWMGVPHSGELPQVWGWTLLKYNEHVRNDTGGLEDFIDWTEEDMRHTVYWNKMYTNFAKFGNPTPTPVEDPLGVMTEWRPFTDDDMAYLYVYNTTCEVRTAFRPQNIALFEHYMGYLARDFLSIFPESIEGTKTETKARGIPAGYVDEFQRAFFEWVRMPSAD